MGLFDNNKQSIIEKTIEEIERKTYLSLDKDDILKLVSEGKDEQFVANLMLKLAKSVTSDDYLFISSLRTLVTDLYPVIVKTKDDLSLFDRIADRYAKNPKIYNSDVIMSIYLAFNDKNLIVEIIDFLNSFVDSAYDSTLNVNHLVKYLIQAREYFVEDRALFASFVNLANTIGKEVLIYGEEKEIEDAISKKLNEDRKANGIYDIGQDELEEISRKVESLGINKQQLNSLVEIAEKTAANIERSVNAAKRGLNDAKNKQIKDLREEADLIVKEFNTNYEAIINQQKEGILAERDTMVAELQRIIDSRRTDFLTLSETLTKSVGLEISRIHTTATNSIDRITDFVANDENVKKIIEANQNNSDFLNRLSIVETVAEHMGVNSGNVDPTNVQQFGQIVVAQPDLGDNLPVNYNINYYFDRSVVFKERFKELMEKKAKMEERGEIFHEKFDDILTMILQNDSPYLYGPSGCGKTYMVKNQIPELLGMKVITNGYVRFEQDILGYTNAGTGAYVPSVFYRAFKYGDIIFLDELDKSNPNAANVLLPFLNREPNGDYTFPNGINLRRHPNFRIITAGNTKASGRTLAYSTSQKLDEAVNQRLMPIAVSYDNRIEEKILEAYKGWYEFIVNYRAALETITADSTDEVNSIGTFTSRDAQDIKDHLDDESFTDEQLMLYHIIETKDADYLSQISSKLQKSNFKTDDGKKLLKLFNEKTKDVKKNGSNNR